MTISQVIDLAIDSPDNLSVAMLHAKVLADRIQNPRLTSWINKELNGYEEVSEVPDYRRFKGQMWGVFQKTMGPSATEQVPIQTMGHEIYGMASEIILPQSVASISRLNDNGTMLFNIGMETELLQIINSNFGYHGQFHKIFNRSPVGAISIVLAEIQRLLVSTLSEISSVIPSNIEFTNMSPQQALAVERATERVDFYAQNIIINSTVESIVNTDMSQNDNRQIRIGDWGDFETFLSEQRVSPKLQERGETVVNQAITESNAGKVSEKAKTQLSQWIQETSEEMVSGVGSALKEETKKEATKLIIEKIKEYGPSLIKTGLFLAITAI